MNRRAFFAMTGAFAAQGAWPGFASAAMKRKHLLLIAVDDLRPTLGCYGDLHAITPHMDALAQRGTRFDRAYVQQAVCSASRASLLTGLRPRETGVDYPYNDAFVQQVVKEHPTFLTRIERAGAWSRMVGKIHHERAGEIEELDSPPQDPGSPGRPWQDYLAPENIEELSSTGKGPAWEAGEGGDSDFQDGRITDEAVSMIREYAGRRRFQPMCMSVGYHKPHLPFVCPKRYYDLYDPDKLPAYQTAPPTGSPAFSRASYELQYQYSGEYAKSNEPIPPDVARNLTHAYYACVSYVDAQVGRLMAALQAEGLAEDTVVVLFGDHGFHLGENAMWGKHSNFEAATRAPLIFAGAGVPRATAVDAIVEFVDIYATVCELVGVEPPAVLAGESLVPLMQGGAAAADDTPRYAFSEFPREQLRGYSARSDRWRYVEWLDTGRGEVVARELYDHRDDGGELQNVAARYPEVVRQMSSVLASRE